MNRNRCIPHCPPVLRHLTFADYTIHPIFPHGQNITYATLISLNNFIDKRLSVPAIDDCQPQIVLALQKEGWQIAVRQYAIYAPGRRNPLYADLLAKKGSQRIIILEIKCFADNLLNELYTAIGQYLIF